MITKSSLDVNLYYTYSPSDTLTLIGKQG